MNEVIELKNYIEFKKDRFVSKLVHDSAKARGVLFSLEKGQELAPHTSSSEVLFHVLEGKGKVLIGSEEVAIKAGQMLFCPAEAPHGLKAEERFVVLAIIAPRPS